MPPDESLPQQSLAHINMGMWYVFHEGDHVIHAWGSDWTGLEKVYFNKVPVVLSHPVKQRANLVFEVAGQHYRLECLSRPGQRWQVKCRLSKDDVPVAEIRCRRRRVFNVRRPMWAQMALGVGVGLLAGFIKAPSWFGLGFILIAFSLTLLTLAKREDFVIEDDWLGASS